eukprot:TRINITY_DN21702_c0_g1_i1.p1 TRINITY_DN21702_c0_g1~~TRINITY_DN21702_c0_g1_i1.p1  ORF type:complete len:726 (+),score=154.23 TRINITY_DN21702_c0_g1_i1:209-2179(+)
MASVGNGYIATTVSSDTQYIGGVYNGRSSIDPSHRARIPATLAITAPAANVTATALDLERGIYYRRSEITLTNGNIQKIEQRWYAHRLYRHLLVHELIVDATGCTMDSQLQLVSTPGANSTDLRLEVVEENSEYQVYVGTTLQPEEPNSDLVEVAYVTSLVPEKVEVPMLRVSTYFFITATATSIDDLPSTPEDTAKLEWNKARNISSDLMIQHVAEWSKVWSSRITVADNLPLAQAINSSLYYILSSIRDDWDYGVSPGGLASNGYNGHMFWDQETWMYPTFAAFYPSIGEGMLRYRFNRIKGAQAKAASYDKGYSGTMYPWESAFTGEEVCPTSAPTGQLEQHISGDIAFAIQQLYRLSGDKHWLKTQGFPMLQGIATFWASRVAVQGDQYVIDGVIPPDEYAVNVNNSVYTNVVAKISLEAAKRAGQVLGESTPQHWDDIAAKLKIPFDDKLQVHPEFDGYHGQLIKQADVILLGYPLMYPMSTTIRKNDLVYYSARTDIANGPAMTFGMSAVAWLELGEPDQAKEEFTRSYANIQEPFNVWTETPKGGTVNFITGAGGFLQGLWAGYAGIRILEDRLTLSPHLPDKVTHLSLEGFYYLGNSLRIEFTEQDLTVSLITSSGATRLALTTSNGVKPLSETPVTVPRGTASIHIL